MTENMSVERNIGDRKEQPVTLIASKPVHNFPIESGVIKYGFKLWGRRSGFSHTEAVDMNLRGEAVDLQEKVGEIRQLAKDFSKDGYVAAIAPSAGGAPSVLALLNAEKVEEVAELCKPIMSEVDFFQLAEIQRAIGLKEDRQLKVDDFFDKAEIDRLATTASRLLLGEDGKLYFRNRGYDTTHTLYRDSVTALDGYFRQIEEMIRLKVIDEDEASLIIMSFLSSEDPHIDPVETGMLPGVRSVIYKDTPGHGQSIVRSLRDPKLIKHLKGGVPVG